MADIRLGFILVSAIVWDTVAVCVAYYPTGNPGWLRAVEVAGALFYTVCATRGLNRSDA